SALEKSLSTESLDESLSIYSKLSSLTELVHDTSTEHLRVYSTNLALYWYAQLKTAIELRMENVLKLIEFPYIRKMPPNVVIELFDTNRDRLKQELAYALKLRLPNNVKHDDVQSRLRFIGWKPIPLFIHMLLKGLITRFNFHFYGKQKTNDRRKPEWYLNQIITWILDHDDFLTKQLQPLIDEFSDVSPINVKVEFIRGLIELIIVKIDSEITSILSDTTLFTHYIEEILIFSQRLFEEDIDYPQDLPSCMNLLCDEIVFEKWFQVEQDAEMLRHYQRLQYFYEEYKIFIKNNGMDNFVDENSNQIDIDSTLAQQFDLIQLNKKNDLIPASIFDHLLEQYRDEEEKNCNIIVNHIVSTLKAKSRRYINEKWSAMPNPKDYFSMNISSSAIDVLLELQTTFANLSINLLKNVSNEIRARVIKQFDEYLFNRIINDYTFNEGGAAQFLFDMNRGWSRIVNDSFSQLFNK
ncbi:unnamed protein product, partial [Rotaria magnacalcarata]